MPFLQYQDKMKYRYFELPEDKMVVFGRETHCDFQLVMDSLISREHFSIERDEKGDMVLIDLGATNGTYLNDERLENDTVILKDSDRIRAGSQHFVYYEKIPSHKTQDLIDEVVDSIDDGKGFRTAMAEIIGDKKLRQQQ